MRLSLKKSASEAPSLPCIIEESSSFTFQEIDHLVEKYANLLFRLGIQEGDRIAFHPSPSVPCIALLFAIWRLNANVCLINPKIPSSQIDLRVKQTAATHYIDNLSHLERIKKLPSTRVLSFHQSLCLFTSGSSSTPKVAVLPLKTLLINAADSIPLNEHSRYLLSLPLFHVGGMGIILRSILKKAAIVLDPKNPLITHLSYVPTHLYRSFPLYKNLECVLLGGAPIASYPDTLPIYITYGLTEMGSMALCKKTPPKIDAHYYLGKPLPQREIRIHSDGEIWVKGNCLFEGYLKNETISLALTQDGWFKTGDVGNEHPELGIAIIGRKDWQFISGGENIQPEEIEKHIKTIPEILDAAVVPMQNEEFGQIPAAFLRTEKDFDLATIQSHLQNFLPKYKLPKALFILDEFPKIGLKIDRKKIIEMANQKN